MDGLIIVKGKFYAWISVLYAFSVTIEVVCAWFYLYVIVIISLQCRYFRDYARTQQCDAVLLEWYAKIYKHFYPSHFDDRLEFFCCLLQLLTICKSRTGCSLSC